jgi:LEA14-like dessication related protein
MSRIATIAIAIAIALAACHAGGSPELRVLGMHDAADAQHVVFVQVTNPASQTMRLTRLEYTFEASGAKISAGEVPLSRDVPADSTVVVEVPLDAARVPAQQPLKLQGKLTAEQDEIERTFSVEADVTR